MKKRVRVYKPGGETQQPTQEQIIGYITQKMQSDDYDPKALSDELVQVGLTDMDAQKYIDYVSDSLYNSGNDYEDPEANNTEAGYAEYGGAKMSKSKFIKKYTKFAKMAQGGDTPSPGNDDVLNGREDRVGGFQKALQGSAQDAILKQEAEAQYHYAYGAPQVGAFQEGGIQQEEVDIENPMHHIGAYAAGLGDIFKNNQNIQNNMPHEQFGGFTDPNSGLYRFMGGGDNESFDEEYQDSDIDFNQEQYAKGGVPRRLRNRDLTARGYYSESGQKIDAPNMQGKSITSVDYLNKNIFGMPRQVRYNYGPGTPQPAAPTAAAPTGEYMPPNEFTGDRQPLANWMMRTGIPGVRGLGAKMIDSRQLPEYDVQKNDPEEIKRIQRFHPNYTPFGLKEEPVTRNYDKPPFTKEQQIYLTKSLRVPDPVYNGTIPLNTTGPANTNFTDFENPKQVYLTEKIKALQSAQKEYGGPIDYTEYAYGGDTSVPELYRAQVGFEKNAFDPNANAIGTTVDYKGDTYDFTGKLIKKWDPKFNFAEGAINEFMKNPYIKDENYVNPLTGEKPGVTMNEAGTYTDNGLVDDATENEDGSFSQLFDVNKRKGNGGKNISTYANIGLAGINEYLARDQMNVLTANLKSAERNFGVSNNKFRGTYGRNNGLLDNMGSTRPVKYGGGVYAMGGNTEDEDENVQYMTEAQIKRFLEEGGELEYL